MRQDKVLGMLGLAQRAGKVKSGSFLTESAIVAGKAKLVIFHAGDLSETGRRLMRKAEEKHIPYLFYTDKESLGRALGKAERSCLAVTDPGFAAQLQKLAAQAAEEDRETAAKPQSDRN